jgi:hypothetical protein
MDQGGPCRLHIITTDAHAVAAMQVTHTLHVAAAGYQMYVSSGSGQQTMKTVWRLMIRICLHHVPCAAPASAAQQTIEVGRVLCCICCSC